MSSKKFIEVNYYYHDEIDDPSQVIRLHRPSNLFAEELKKEMSVTLIKHMNFQGELNKEGIHYSFNRSRNRFTHIPFKSHRQIARNKPDVVLVQGLIFPLQVIALRMKLGSRCKIILQHHGEVPFGRKRILQKWADRYIDAYLFTSAGNSLVWRTAGIIRDEHKCFEFPSASTVFTLKDKTTSRRKLGMTGCFNFIWVGRLDANKDPLTVVRAFGKYAEVNADARLYMVFQRHDLLDEIKSWLDDHPAAKAQIQLIGKVNHDELEVWYNAADYFISGSHHEGGSYALIEAMACGCIPIVTNIPASMKAIDNGGAGYYFEPGDEESLLSLLSGLQEPDQSVVAGAVRRRFKSHLSAEAIASNLLQIVRSLE